MRNKLIVIAGDSVIQQTYNSLQVILSAMGIAFRISHKYYRYYGSAFELMEQEVCDIDHAKFQSFCGLRPNTEPRSLCNCSIVFHTIIPQYNMTIAYIFFYTIAIPESYANDAVQIKMFNHLQYSLFEHWVALSDATIANVGVHYDRVPTFYYAQLVRYVLLLDSN